MNFLVVTVAAAATLVAIHALTFTIGRRLGRYNVVDVAWGVGFVAVAAVAAALGAGDLLRRVVLLVLVAIWGLRLASHTYRISMGKGEDPRYAAMLGEHPSAALVLRKIFLVQLLATWFVSLPLQLSATSGPTPTALLPVATLGIALWLVGVTFETLGDRQLRIFKADPANRGRVMDRGLWAWTRHPNYFGDAAVWWGLWLITINGWLALSTVLSPAVMTYFLVFATGARLLEKHMADRAGFPEYQARTSFFVPWPPAKME